MTEKEMAKISEKMVKLSMRRGWRSGKIKWRN